MKIFCYIPGVCIKPGEDVASQVRRQLAIALASNLSPTGLPAGLTGIAIDIADDQHTKIKELASTLHLAPGRVIGGLLYAMHLHGTKHADKSAPEPILKGLRSGQSKCLQEAAPLLSSGKIVLTEAGTGSGKARLLAHAAQFAIQMRNSKALPCIAPIDTEPSDSAQLPLWIREFAAQAQDVLRDRIAEMPPGTAQRAVILCAPSIENVAHLVREWSTSQPVVDPDGLLTTAVILGRGQFVSSSLLTEAIANAEPECDTSSIEQWLNDGMPAGLTPSTRHLQKLNPRIHGLMTDLESLSIDANFPFQNAALDEDCPNEEQALYRDIRESAMTSDLVFTTHAMFCLDSMYLANRDMKPLLPIPAAVFIDEAHLLEHTQASVAAKSLSMARLSASLRSDVWARLRKDTAAKTAGALIKRVINTMVNIPHETSIPLSTSEDADVISAWNASQIELADLAKQLATLIKIPKNSDITAEQNRALKYAEKAMHTLESIRKEYKGYIEHSPVRSQISFNVGPSSVEKYLCARWATTPCAMMASGTLLHIGAQGATASPITRDLAIPVERGAATIPMHPAWIFETPKVLMPASDIFHRYVPPTGKLINDPEAMAYWLHECAKVVALAAKDAAGGTLVLMTGYDRLTGLHEALAAYPELQERLIVQSRTQRVSVCSSVFKTQARAGKRPIWLATGAAWTGLDLADETISDKEAHKDLILTDMIMPNLPFGLVRTTTHVARTSRIGFAAEAIVTQRQFRQGIGRLIRREGLLHRRLWLLDGRLQHPSAINYMMDFRRVLMPYIHREPFMV